MVASGKPDKIKPLVFHQVELERGWRILRQHLDIHVDINAKKISGTARFTICALNNRCAKVALNLRRCAVTQVRVNNLKTAHHVVSPLDDNNLLELVSDYKCRARVCDLKHSVSLRDKAAASQGELLINLPSSISADAIDQLTALSTVDDAENKVELDPAATNPPAVPLSQLPIIQIEVGYEVLDSNAGAIYHGNPNEDIPVRDPLYMLTESRFGMARFWMPCVDSMNWCDRYLFDMDISVDPHLVVVASGELVTIVRREEKTPHGKQALDTYKYRLNAPAHASEILLAVGPFIPVPDEALNTTVTHFCLPGLVRELHFTSTLIVKALAFCRDYFGTDPPCNSLKNLFVGSMGSRTDSSIVGAGGLIVHSGDILHDARCIDEGFLAREVFMHSLVESYLGRFLRPRSEEDRWLILGLASHISTLGMQLILGLNWYRFRIQDLMGELQQEQSCDLSDVNLDFVSPSVLDSVRRRSHVIIYMVERRIGADVMKRALRDIVAEGKRTTVSAVRYLDEALQKPYFVGESDDRVLTVPFLPKSRILKDWNGCTVAATGATGVVSTGFDEAVLGVAVGPFLKRIRAICGTDIRSMVRLWASNPGIPRLNIGYQYNARKHTVEFVVKQEVDKEVQVNQQPSIPFHGSINIRVMESEGAYDHSIEISDAIFATEVQCHSRRPKAKPVGTEKEFAEEAPKGSSVSWIRFDPDHEWCKETTFQQQESSWASMLTGERDAIGQFEACRGLRKSSNEKSRSSLLTVLKDPQVYWRVRAEAASVLASTSDGLKSLINYFKSCYTDAESCIIRPNNFSNVADYFVKKAMISAIASARLKGTYSSARPGGSVPVEASQFLSKVLGGLDNAGNEFQDDHYVEELLISLTDIAIASVGDELHQTAGEEGQATTESISQLLKRFQSLEQMEQRRSSLVASTIVKSLCDIERAKLMTTDVARQGSISRQLRSGQITPDKALMNKLFDLTRRRNAQESRLTVLQAFVETYPGNAQLLRWIVAFIDRDSSNFDIIKVGMDNTADQNKTITSFTESPSLRFRLIEVLCEVAQAKGWSGASPLLQTIRSPGAIAKDVCLRLMRLVVGDADPRIRLVSHDLMKVLWGVDVPVCLLSREEYSKFKLTLDAKQSAPVELVSIQSHLGKPLVAPAPPPTVSPKGAKQIKSSKSGKTGKVSKLPKSILPLRSVAPPPQAEKTPVSETIDVDAPVLTPLPSTVDKAPSPSSRPVLPPIPLSRPVGKIGRSEKKVQRPEKKVAKPTLVALPKSVVVDRPSKEKPSRTLLRSVPPTDPFANLRVSWHPLDEEDARLFHRAWKENKSSVQKPRLIPKSKPIPSSAPKLVEDLPQLSDEARFPSSSINGSASMENGDDREHKKKKKKKRKRHDDEDDNERKKKKKKKKKKRRESGEYGTGDEDSLSLSGHGEDRAPGDKKIGKIQIRLPPRPSGQLASGN